MRFVVRRSRLRTDPTPHGHRRQVARAAGICGTSLEAQASGETLELAWIVRKKPIWSPS
jgi:hypothetical protein